MFEVNEKNLKPYEFEQIRFLKHYEEQRVHYSAWQEHIEDCMDWIRQRQVHSNVSNLRITGDTGAGKTTLVNELIEKMGGNSLRKVVDETGIYFKRHALLTVLPKKITVKNMIMNILSGLGFENIRLKNASEFELTRALINAVSKCGLKVLFLDEFHHIRISTRNSSPDYSAVVLWLKQICKETDLCIVAVGTDHVDAMLQSDPEVNRLFNYGVCISSLPYSNDADSDYRQFLRGFEKIVNESSEGKISINLSSAQIRSQLWLATSGNVWAIKEMIKAVCMASIKDQYKNQPEQFFPKVERSFMARMAHESLGKKKAFEMNKKQVEVCLESI